jgi:hypothetical protein
MTHLAAAALLQLCCAPYLLPGRTGSTSTTLCAWVPRHVARLITQLVAPLIIDYVAYAARPIVTRLVAPLVVDYFTYAERPGASARRAARHAARRATRRRLLRLRRTSGCLDTSRGSSRGSSRRSSSTTSPTPSVRVPRHLARLVTRLVAPLVVDYFAYAACPGASARRAARHAVRLTARRRLLRLRRASGCLGTSRGSSSTTSPTPRVRVPWHIVRLVATTCLAATLALLRVCRAPP